MSEKDLKLGGAAAKSFSNPGAYADNPNEYQNSDDVRDYYLDKIAKEEAKKASEGTGTSSIAGGGGGSGNASAALPIGWEGRQRVRETDERQYGAFARNKPAPAIPRRTEPSSAPTSNFAGLTLASSGSGSAEAILVRVASQALNGMAEALEKNPSALTQEERAEFAAAVSRAVGAIAKCR